MDKGLLPRRYAKALYKYALEKNATESLYTAMLNVELAFENNPSLQTTIANPFVAVQQKRQLLTTAAQTDSAVFDDFISLLAKNNRIDIFRQIALAYTELYRKENNIYLVNITSASKLSDTDKERLTSMIEKHIGNAKAQYTFDVNPDIIGGFIVRIDNELLDASVQNELKQLRKALIS